MPQVPPKARKLTLHKGEQKVGASPRWAAPLENRGSPWFWPLAVTPRGPLFFFFFFFFPGHYHKPSTQTIPQTSPPPPHWQSHWAWSVNDSCVVQQHSANHEGGDPGSTVVSSGRSIFRCA
eukprot:FR740916.1.p3 GENE.FR740916.1~~FR740916.1.p3  ORF type:complete len:121 (-),score=25.36 FR740916.1:612-974(-)